MYRLRVGTAVAASCRIVIVASVLRWQNRGLGTSRVESSLLRGNLFEKGVQTKTMSNSEDEDIPDMKTCQKLTEQFAEITGTDVACAQFYLQDRKWDLQRSVNAFFESTQKGGINFTSDGDTPEIVINVDKKMVTNLGMMTTEPPSKFKLFSWNIDGLSEHNLKIRTKAVCKTIQLEKPDIVFFQEVIPETLNYIKDKLPEYVCIAGNTQGYFVATFLRRFTVYYDSHRVVEFPSSLMMRNYIATEAHIGPLNLLLINTHLESTADHVAERVNQLKRIFQEMLTCPEEKVVICGGDLNLREKDLTAAGGLPPGVEDLWVSCGSRKTCQYTWDMLRNTNVEFPGKYKPRFRFDRLYLRNSHQKSIVPEFFGLVGIEKVTRTQSYPSDHWGIQVHFTIEKR